MNDTAIKSTKIDNNIINFTEILPSWECQVIKITKNVCSKK